tara:strand:- start:4 stop:558 length:555 start_codon:yes stop_codon:yes gene_type:complete
MPKDNKVNTFFIREQVIAPATQARAVQEVDIGAYVNIGTTRPQGLRIHSIQVAFTDDEGLVPVVDPATNVADGKSAFACVSLTTKETSLASPNMPMLNDDETVFTASVTSTNLNDDKDQGIASAALDLAPQHLVNGYLLGVGTLYLYGIADDAWDEDVYISICMECSTEAIDKDNAVNLALSQS